MMSRFALLVVIARFFSPSETGLYGLLMVTVASSLYVVGLDFYTFSTRELIQGHDDRLGFVIRNQLRLAMPTYAVALPLGLMLFWFELLPWWTAVWFFAIVPLEHLAQEWDRLLIALDRQVQASILLFMRNALWTFVVMPLIIWQEGLRELWVVLLAWALGTLTACVLGTRWLRAVGLAGWAEPGDYAWIRQGVRMAVPFLIGTVAVRLISTLDRYLIQAVASDDVLGAYVLFSGLTGALGAVMAAAVHVFRYPSLLATAHSGNLRLFNITLRKMVAETLTISALFVCAMVTLVPSLVTWLGHEVYADFYWMLYWLLPAAVLMNLSMVAHYGLYALRRDARIVTTGLAALLVFLVTVCGVLAVRSDLAVPSGVLAASAALLVMKVIALKGYDVELLAIDDPLEVKLKDS